MSLIQIWEDSPSRASLPLPIFQMVAHVFRSTDLENEGGHEAPLWESRVIYEGSFTEIMNEFFTSLHMVLNRSLPEGDPAMALSDEQLAGLKEVAEDFGGRCYKVFQPWFYLSHDFLRDALGGDDIIVASPLLLFDHSIYQGDFTGRMNAPTARFMDREGNWGFIFRLESIEGEERYEVLFQRGLYSRIEDLWEYYHVSKERIQSGKNLAQASMFPHLEIFLDQGDFSIRRLRVPAQERVQWLVALHHQEPFLQRIFDLVRGEPVGGWRMDVSQMVIFDQTSKSFTLK